MFLSVIHIGPYQNALYKCDDCGDRYNVFGMVDGPEFMAWCEPYNEQFCYRCFSKHADATPLFQSEQIA